MQEQVWITKHNHVHFLTDWIIIIFKVYMPQAELIKTVKKEWQNKLCYAVFNHGQNLYELDRR